MNDEALPFHVRVGDHRITSTVSGDVLLIAAVALGVAERSMTGDIFGRVLNRRALLGYAQDRVELARLEA